jgi:WD40 repeat protein
MSAVHPTDRIGQRLPELLEELGAPRLPDYYDDLLRTTAATRQQPSWASLERWLPMGVVARPAPFGLPSWRPIVLFVVLVLAAMALIAVAAGSPRIPKLAPLSGLASNGLILAGTADGDILSIDPATGRTTPWLATSVHERRPYFTASGGILVYSVRNPNETLYAAKPDGTDARRVFATEPGDLIEWIDVSPDGRSLVVGTRDHGTQLADVASGTVSPLVAPGMTIKEPLIRPNGELVFVGTDEQGQPGLYGMRPGSAPRQIGELGQGGETSFTHPSLSLDGSILTYFLWNETVEGELHTRNVDSGADRPIAIDDAQAPTNLQPVLSPDGSMVAYDRYAYEGGYRVAVVPTAGGVPIVLGDRRADGSDGAIKVFSPDGTKLLVRYNDDGSVVIFDLATGSGTPVAGTDLEELAWQRVGE